MRMKRTKRRRQANTRQVQCDCKSYIRRTREGWWRRLQRPRRRPLLGGHHKISSINVITASTSIGDETRPVIRTSEFKNEKDLLKWSFAPSTRRNSFQLALAELLPSPAAAASSSLSLSTSKGEKGEHLKMLTTWNWILRMNKRAKIQKGKQTEKLLRVKFKSNFFPMPSSLTVFFFTFSIFLLKKKKQKPKWRLIWMPIFWLSEKWTGHTHARTMDISWLEFYLKAKKEFRWFSKTIFILAPKGTTGMLMCIISDVISSEVIISCLWMIIVFLVFMKKQSSSKESCTTKRNKRKTIQYNAVALETKRAHFWLLTFVYK